MLDLFRCNHVVVMPDMIAGHRLMLQQTEQAAVV